MKIQLLPNFFKWIGLLFYIGGGIPSFIKGWYSADCCNEELPTTLLASIDEWYFLTSTLSLIGIILYALSKEKIEDEYVRILRWESVSTSFVITVGIVLINILVVGREKVIESDFLIELQLLFFLIIFYFKKRNLAD